LIYVLGFTGLQQGLDVDGAVVGDGRFVGNPQDVQIDILEVEH
jgi:hypothetical protein